MCDKNKNDSILEESKDSFDIAFEKEFGTIEERSRRRYTISEMLDEEERMTAFCKRWKHELW